MNPVRSAKGRDGAGPGCHACDAGPRTSLACGTPADVDGRTSSALHRFGIGRDSIEGLAGSASGRSRRPRGRAHGLQSGSHGAPRPSPAAGCLPHPPTYRRGAPGLRCQRAACCRQNGGEFRFSEALGHDGPCGRARPKPERPDGRRAQLPRSGLHAHTEFVSCEPEAALQRKVEAESFHLIVMGACQPGRRRPSGRRRLDLWPCAALS